MARLARVVAVGVPHHITQRSNGRLHSRFRKRLHDSGAKNGEPTVLRDG
jgi:hypothetical protein